jgi:hypothetical protein
VRNPVGDDLHLGARVCVERHLTTEVKDVFGPDQRLQPEVMSCLTFPDRGTELRQERLLPNGSAKSPETYSITSRFPAITVNAWPAESFPAGS